jgi:hypothetical protein
MGIYVWKKLHEVKAYDVNKNKNKFECKHETKMKFLWWNHEVTCGNHI